MRKPYKVPRPGGGFYPEYHFRYLDEHGVLKSAKASSDLRVTQKMQIQKEIDIQKKREALERGEVLVVKEDVRTLAGKWLKWGAQFGGKRKGTGWSAKHLENKDREINWWIDVLGVTYLHQFTVEAVENALAARREEAVATKKGRGASGGTMAEAAGTLRAFLGWCIRNNKIGHDPLKNLIKFDKTPENPRRPLTLEDLVLLASVISWEESLVYRMAMNTGGRKGELDGLRIEAMDWQARTVDLEWGETKNRKEAVFRLPVSLVDDLRVYATGKGPKEKLLPPMSKHHAGLVLQRKCAKVGIPYRTKKGKIDFHSFRHTFATELVKLTDPKTAQVLLRHSDARLTVGLYAHGDARLIDQAIHDLDARLTPHFRAIPRTGWLQKTDKTPGESDAGRVVIGQGGDAQPVRILSPRPTVGPEPSPQTPATLNPGEFTASGYPSTESPQSPDASAHDADTKNRQKDLDRLKAIWTALSPENLAAWLDHGERLAQNQAATTRLHRRRG